MSGPQTTVNFVRALGVPGELAYNGPVRAKPALLNSAQASYNIIGATAYTQSVPASDGDPNAPITAVAGGAGIFAGILANPKEYASFGGSTGPLSPTMTLPNHWNAVLVTMGEMFVTLPAAAAPGDRVLYDNTTGALSSAPDSASFTGVIAVTTGILTVSAASAGANIGVSTVLHGTGVPGGTLITALIGGTGGNGTYQTNIITAVASTPMTATNLAPTGKTFVPNAAVEIYQPTGAGLALIKLTN